MVLLGAWGRRITARRVSAGLVDFTGALVLLGRPCGDQWGSVGRHLEGRESTGRLVATQSSC